MSKYFNVDKQTAQRILEETYLDKNGKLFENLTEAEQAEVEELKKIIHEK